MKAIETNYNGYKFRSRIEARWAVFFDSIGIKYEYEKEGYDLGGLYYLPDFWLPQVDCFAEVKPDFPLEEIEERKVLRLVEQSQKPCILLIGAPDFVSYLQVEYSPVSVVIEMHLDVLLNTDYLSERRFYINTGADPFEFQQDNYDALYHDDRYREAVFASRRARFDT